MKGMWFDFAVVESRLRSITAKPKLDYWEAETQQPGDEGNEGDEEDEEEITNDK